MRNSSWHCVLGGFAIENERVTPVPGTAISTYWPAQNLSGCSVSSFSWRISCVTDSTALTVAGKDRTRIDRDNRCSSKLSSSTTRSLYATVLQSKTLSWSRSASQKANVEYFNISMSPSRSTDLQAAHWPSLHPCIRVTP